MVTRYTGAYFPPSSFPFRLAFKAAIILGYDVQSCPFSAWRSEPPCLLSHIVQSHLFQPDIPSYRFSLAFRAIVQLGIQCHLLPLVLVFRAIFSFWHLMTPSFFILALKAASSIWRSESHFHFDIQIFVFLFGVQSNIFILAFRAAYSVRHQSYHIFRLAFRIVHFPFSVQSHIFISTFRSLFFCSAFRATSLFRRSKAASLVTAFRVTIILNLAFRAASPVWRLEPSSYHDRAFIATFSTFKATFLAFRATYLFWHSEPHL